MLQIEWVGMTRAHYQPGKPARIRMVVLHATAGRAPSDLAWLRKGGDERRPVSIHYYINKHGAIMQLVHDNEIAWHAGVSRWTVDGQIVNACNAVSIGIELENLNDGRDPYPDAQLNAAVALTRGLVQRYNVPQSQLVRHLDIAPGRKTDPAGFPWSHFVAEVYAGAAGEPQPTRCQLQRHMLDLAYRAAGSALPADWPLYAAAQAARLGMPVAAITGQLGGAPAGTAQDDLDRPVRIEGQPPLAVEVYARDLLYAPLPGSGDAAPAPNTAQSLADTPPGPLREALLDLLFASADPVNGYQRSWAFHRYYQANAAQLGAPLGPSHRVTLGPHQRFACQHYALDSLCSPVGAWQTIYRLSELQRELPGLELPLAATLRRLLLDDLYRTQTGRRYDSAALLTRYAEARKLGAPLAAPEVTVIESRPWLLVPYALDLLACQIPRPDWPLEQPLPDKTAIIALSELESPATLGAPQTHAAGPQLCGGHLLGTLDHRPPVLDVELMRPGLHCRRRMRAAPDLILICDTHGPYAADLQQQRATPCWHYYVAAVGAVCRLRAERYLVGPADASPAELALADRAIIIAVEGGAEHAGAAQRAALVWLVRLLTTSLQIASERVCFGSVSQPLAIRPRAALHEKGVLV